MTTQPPETEMLLSKVTVVEPDPVATRLIITVVPVTETTVAPVAM